MKIIGFAGKGGTGKTTLAALFLKALIEREGGEILVIDSDPNECLPSVLGVKKFIRLSDIVKGYEGKTINPLEFSQNFASMLVENEQENFDLIVMGRGESEGCYCLINHLLKSSFEKNVLGGGFSYEYILMDCEAGIEHISRKTSTLIHNLIVITDASKTGLDTIKRIKDVSKEVKSDVKNFYAAANKVNSTEVEKKIKETADSVGMLYLGALPFDATIEEFNFNGKTLLKLPSNTKAYQEAKRMLEKVLEK